MTHAALLLPKSRATRPPHPSSGTRWHTPFAIGTRQGASRRPDGVSFGFEAGRPSIPESGPRNSCCVARHRPHSGRRSDARCKETLMVKALGFDFGTTNSVL